MREEGFLFDPESFVQQRSQGIGQQDSGTSSEVAFDLGALFWGQAAAPGLH